MDLCQHDSFYMKFSQFFIYFESPLIFFIIDNPRKLKIVVLVAAKNFGFL